MISMNAVHYTELFSFNNMRSQLKGGSELEGFDDYFGSSKRIEQLVMMIKQIWLCPSYSMRHERRRMMMERRFGS
jgi:hypothetical protein